MSTQAESPNQPVDALSTQLAAIPVPLDEEKNKFGAQPPQVVPVKRRSSSTSSTSLEERPPSSHHAPELVKHTEKQDLGSRQIEYDSARHSLHNIDERHKLHLVSIDETHIKPDTEIDSSGNSVGSITAQSTVFDFKYENGRTYHNFRAGKYFLPNDEAEQNRLEKLHHFFLLTYGGRLHLAPLENPRKVLDLGTGTGIWAIEFGDEFPDAEVTGIGKSPLGYCRPEPRLAAIRALSDTTSGHTGPTRISIDPVPRPHASSQARPTRVYKKPRRKRSSKSDLAASYNANLQANQMLREIEDLSPIQPNWLPENVKFEIDDYEEDWLREPNSYDYIHGRTLMGSVKDWPRLMSQIYDHLAPGGYVELQETDLTGGRSDDGTFRTDSAFGVYQENLKKAGNLAGLPTDAAPMLAQMMLDAGFVEVREHRVKIPVGTWPKDKKLKEIGSWAQEIVADGLEPYCMALFTRVLGMAKEEATQICDNAKKSLGDRSTHMYFFNHFVYGRKPDHGNFPAQQSS